MCGDLTGHHLQEYCRRLCLFSKLIADGAFITPLFNKHQGKDMIQGIFCLLIQWWNPTKQCCLFPQYKDIFVFCASLQVGCLHMLKCIVYFAVYSNLTPYLAHLRNFWARIAEGMCPETIFSYFLVSHYFQLRPMGIRRMSQLQESLETISLTNILK